MTERTPDAIRAEITRCLTEALGTPPERAGLGVIESHWMALLEAIWQIETAFDVTVALNDNLPASGIRNGRDLARMLMAAVGSAA